jgi:hypothetical protein
MISGAAELLGVTRAWVTHLAQRDRLPYERDRHGHLIFRLEQMRVMGQARRAQRQADWGSRMITNHPNGPDPTPEPERNLSDQVNRSRNQRQRRRTGQRQSSRRSGSAVGRRRDIAGVSTTSPDNTSDLAKCDLCGYPLQPVRQPDEQTASSGYGQAYVPVEQVCSHPDCPEGLLSLPSPLGRRRWWHPDATTLEFRAGGAARQASQRR